MNEINNASVLGFIPDPHRGYPTGVILAERWNSDRQVIEWFTARVADIDGDEYTDEIVRGQDWEQARRDLLTRTGIAEINTRRQPATSDLPIDQRGDWFDHVEQGGA